MPRARIDFMILYVNIGEQIETTKREQNKCLRKEGQHKKRHGRNTQCVFFQQAVRRSVM